MLAWRKVGFFVCIIDWTETEDVSSAVRGSSSSVPRNDAECNFNDVVNGGSRVTCSKTQKSFSLQPDENQPSDDSRTDYNATLSCTFSFHWSPFTICHENNDTSCATNSATYEDLCVLSPTNHNGWWPAEPRGILMCTYLGPVYLISWVFRPPPETCLVVLEHV